MTKLSNALPKGQSNGLESIAADLISAPHQTHVLVAIVDCKSIQTDTDTGDEIPTARIRRIEPVRMDKEQVVTLLRRALEERTGQAVLPMETEDELRSLLDNLGE